MKMEWMPAWYVFNWCQPLPQVARAVPDGSDIDAEKTAARHEPDGSRARPRHEVRLYHRRNTRHSMRNQKRTLVMAGAMSVLG